MTKIKLWDIGDVFARFCYAKIHFQELHFFSEYFSASLYKSLIVRNTGNVYV